MPFFQWVLFTIPSVWLGLFIVGGAVILSVTGLLLVRRMVPHYRLKLHNDVAGPIFSTLGVVYAVLLAFVVIIVWENFDKSTLNVEYEASYLAAVYRDAEAMSPEFITMVHKDIREYRDLIVHDEWKLLAQGKASPLVEAKIRQLWSLYTAYSPRNATEQAFFEESIRKLNSVRELRRIRLMDSSSGIHPLLWFVLIVGGFVTVSFTYFFGVENKTAQMAMAILLAMTISLILYTIFSMDYPFTGDIIVSPDPFKQLILD
ncbi:MAG TPA: DUF4239 domain-containing protein [Candidatus Omnitrophota bacterium]|nr:DUF4239 domain-containing protein [Candidatus Omnitrophota bacterium]HPT06959.1 DUF4239 domain-containing protein [Candidatus Omnitrophota bacterium]